MEQFGEPAGMKRGIGKAQTSSAAQFAVQNPNAQLDRDAFVRSSRNVSPLSPFTNPLAPTRRRHCLRSVHPAIRSITGRPHQISVPRPPSGLTQPPSSTAVTSLSVTDNNIKRGSRLFFRVCFCFYTAAGILLKRPSAVARLPIADGASCSSDQVCDQTGSPALGATPDQFPRPTAPAYRHQGGYHRTPVRLFGRRW